MHARWPGKRSPSDRINEFTEAHMYAQNRKTNAQWHILEHNLKAATSTDMQVHIIITQNQALIFLFFHNEYI